MPSRLEEILRMEDVLSQIAQEVGLPEERTSLFVVAVTEALSNAILHGNRQDPSRSVHVRFRYLPAQDSSTPAKLRVEVEDEGPGFDPSSLPDPTEEKNLLRESGRGIFLMRHLADLVEFHKGGRCVVLEFLL
jgi:serine/threonine-protein kinase RsbW